MTIENLKRANELSLLIGKKESMLKSTIEQKTEWIYFTFGNGSNRVLVCDDLGLIIKIRALIIANHEDVISQLKEELSSL